MKRPIIEEYEANELLSPHYKDIIISWQNGFRDMLQTQSLLKNIDEQVHYESKPLNKSIQIWNNSMNWAKYIFKDKTEVDFVEHSYNSTWFNFSDLIYLRYKKLDDTLKPANAKSNRMDLIRSQAEIPGFPSSPTLVEAGYTTDKTFSSIHNVYIVCWHGGAKAWQIDLVQKTGHQLYVFETPELAKTNLGNLLKVRKQYRIKKEKHND